MSALGQKRTFSDTLSNVRYWGQSGHRESAFCPLTVLEPTMSGFGGKADIRAAVSPALLRAIQALPRRGQQGVTQALWIIGLVVLEVAMKNQKIDIAPRYLNLDQRQPFAPAPAKATHSNDGGGVAGGHRGSLVGLAVRRIDPNRDLKAMVAGADRPRQRWPAVRKAAVVWGGASHDSIGHRHWHFSRR